MNETFEAESLDSREGYCTCLKGFRALAQRRRGSPAAAHMDVQSVVDTLEGKSTARKQKG
ncbi:hypothetical protein [Desulfitobacterium sp. Sab5]|uniref:hypothetical protein n=1 Tax=Desulfitobacterium TaxID=36853 RepID=UPI003CE88CEB